MTASEIAAETGLSQQTVSKALDLLRESRWVRGAKVPGGDQRLTFYSLREPMLRHHFQWRATQGEPLRLIVDLLREWYDPTQLRVHLSRVEPTLASEAYLAESLSAHPPAHDLAANTGTPDALLAVAREWIHGGDPVYSPESGLYAELCAMFAKNPAADVTALLRRRHEQHPQLPMPPESTVAALAALAADGGGLAGLLQRAADRSTGEVAASLTLIAAGLLGRTEPARARSLLAGADADPASPLGLAIRLEYLSWARDVGDDPRTTLQQVIDVLPAVEAVAGPDGAMALSARAQVAFYTGETGDAAGALRLYRELLDDSERVVGPDDRDTLSARHGLAFYTGRTGDAAGALRLFRELLDDSERVVGPDDIVTKLTRKSVEHLSRSVADRAGILDRLVRARAGDEEARIRLPSELRQMAESDRGPGPLA